MPHERQDGIVPRFFWDHQGEHGRRPGEAAERQEGRRWKHARIHLQTHRVQFQHQQRTFRGYPLRDVHLLHTAHRVRYREKSCDDAEKIGSFSRYLCCCCLLVCGCNVLDIWYTRFLSSPIISPISYHYYSPTSSSRYLIVLVVLRFRAVCPCCPGYAAYKGRRLSSRNSSSASRRSTRGSGDASNSATLVVAARPTSQNFGDGELTIHFSENDKQIMSAAQPQGLDTATGAAAANTSGRRGMGRMVPHASSGTAHHEDDLDSSTAGAVTVVAAAVNDRPPTGASTRVRRMRSHRSSGREEYSGDYWKKHHDGTRTHPVLQHLFGLSAIANHSTSKRTWERDVQSRMNRTTFGFP